MHTDHNFASSCVCLFYVYFTFRFVFIVPLVDYQQLLTLVNEVAGKGQGRAGKELLVFLKTSNHCMQMSENTKIYTYENILT